MVEVISYIAKEEVVYVLDGLTIEIVILITDDLMISIGVVKVIFEEVILPVRLEYAFDPLIVKLTRLELKLISVGILMIILVPKVKLTIF